VVAVGAEEGDTDGDAEVDVVAGGDFALAPAPAALGPGGTMLVVSLARFTV
jgi:hypothetical protein